ncbi:MAG: cbb3-type cytochrome oxidase assembly protein CcoS [bacterium]|nr:cbb3-type cytochrome oxidase assembly protein CcoS [bacterium]
MWTTLMLIAVSLALGFAAWLLFMWAVKSDQYDDVERPKHRMLDDDAGKDGTRADQADSPARAESPPPDRT